MGLRWAVEAPACLGGGEVELEKEAERRSHEVQRIRDHVVTSNRRRGVPEGEGGGQGGEGAGCGLTRKEKVAAGVEKAQGACGLTLPCSVLRAWSCVWHVLGQALLHEQIDKDAAAGRGRLQGRAGSAPSPGRALKIPVGG